MAAAEGWRSGGISSGKAVAMKAWRRLAA